MAKDKKKTDLSTEAAIKKHFGKIISTGTELRKKMKDYKVLSVSPNMDLGLNGGIREGSWTVISGNPKTGKSSTCLQICKNAQEEGRNVIYLDAESRLKDYNLVGVTGLDLDKFQVVHGEEEGEALCAEDFLEATEAMMKMPKNKGAVVVIDSCSSLVTRSDLESPPSSSLRATLPKLLTHWVKKNAHTVTQNKLIILVITHYITNTSGYGKFKLPDCGVQIQYQADTRLDISKNEDWEEGGKKIGQKIIWTVGCSSMGASGNEVTSYLRYGVGLDKVQEMIELAELVGLIDKGGSWYTATFLENELDYTTPPKVQGQEKLYKLISDDQKIYDMMKKKIKEIFV
jgi:recombination protein RecA